MTARVQISNTKARKHLFYSPFTKRKQPNRVAFLFARRTGFEPPLPPTAVGGWREWVSERKTTKCCFSRTVEPKQGAEGARPRATHGDVASECAFQIPPPQPKTKAVHWTAFSFLERCVPQAERDAHFVRDAGFAL